MARGNALLNWFKKYAPCFTSGSFTSEDQDRMSSSGSRTPRTNRRSENTGSSSGEGDVTSSSKIGGDVASSSTRGGDVGSSSRGGGDVASSSNTAKDGTRSGTREIDRFSMTPGTSSWNIEVERFNRSGGSSTPLLGSMTPKTPTGSRREGENILTVRVDDNFQLWTYFDYGEHMSEQYSWARVGARPRDFNTYVEVKLVDSGMYVGLYHAHGSSNLCAIYQQKRLFRNAINAANPAKKNSNAENLEAALSQAFETSDKEWLDHVLRNFSGNRLLAAAGTSAVVGLFGGSHFYIANAGDSRAVISSIDETDTIRAGTLTKDDNVNNPEVRAQVLGENQQDPQFITEDTRGVFRIKGRSELSKSIGDAYLKLSSCNLDDYPEYRLNSPIVDDQMALSATPFTVKTLIQGDHQCVIFASSELWNVLTATEVAMIVHFNPRNGIAATVIRHALKKVAEHNHVTYSELQKRASEGHEDPFYKDFAVVIVFFAEEGTVRSTSTETLFFDSLEGELSD